MGLAVQLGRDMTRTRPTIPADRPVGVRLAAAEQRHERRFQLSLGPGFIGAIDLGSVAGFGGLVGVRIEPGVWRRIAPHQGLRGHPSMHNLAEGDDAMTSGTTSVYTYEEAAA